MNDVILQLGPVYITPWKIIGYLGVALFAGRWFVQVYASNRNRRPTVPRLFWYMSMTGSLMLLAYFIFGKNDSVGILSNLFPALIAAYNLYLDVTDSRQRQPEDANIP